MPEADLPRDLCGVCLSDQDIEPHLACLSVAERRRASGIRHPRARRHFVLGRSALRGLLGSQFGLAPKDVCLRVGDDGAVRCDVPGWHCSIAHSNARVIASVARRPIGIDIELIKPRDPGIAGYLLRPDERESFDALPLDQTRAIILYWSLKEAALKAMHIGLRQSAKACRLEVNMAERTATAQITKPPAELNAAFAEEDGYYVSAAWGAAAS